MRKTFSFTSTKHKPDRQFEMIKSEINKYIARERRKDLPEDVDFWDFDCKCGPDEKSAVAIHISTIGKEIDKVYQEKKDSVYVEILAKPGIRTPKPKERFSDDEEQDIDEEFED